MLKKLIPALGTDPGIEWWAIGSLILALIAFALSGSTMWLTVPFLVIGILRVLEVLINAVHVTLFHGFIDKKPLAGNRRIVLLLLFNYAEIVLWFAAGYRALTSNVAQLLQADLVAILAYSLSAASGFGGASLSQITSTMGAISLCESGIGLFMAVAVIARFVSLLPPPPQIPSEKSGP
jgi:hypothetical protein